MSCMNVCEVTRAKTGSLKRPCRRSRTETARSASSTTTSTAPALAAPLRGAERIGVCRVADFILDFAGDDFHALGESFADDLGDRAVGDAGADADRAEVFAVADPQRRAAHDGFHC